MNREELVKALRERGQNCGRHSPMAAPKGCATEVAYPRDWCLSCLALAAADLLEGRETEAWPAVVSDFVTWAEATFPEATPASCAEHLRREVEELQDEGGADPSELADCAMLIFHAAHRAGVDLHGALVSKLATNRAREWGDADEHGVREHLTPQPEGKP